jgi:hypothetical protein
MDYVCLGIADGMAGQADAVVLNFDGLIYVSNQN